MGTRIFKGAEFLVAEATKDQVFTPEDFTPEQKQIADTAEKFVRSEVVPV
jgi:hypothetical protein